MTRSCSFAATGILVLLASVSVFAQEQIRAQEPAAEAGVADAQADQADQPAAASASGTASQAIAQGAAMGNSEQAKSAKRSRGPPLFAAR